MQDQSTCKMQYVVYFWASDNYSGAENCSNSIAEGDAAKSNKDNEMQLYMCWH